MKKLSKVLSVVLAVAMLCSMSFAVSAATYTDVKTSDSYYEAVEALSALGVVKGYEAGDFQPEGKITRAEAATMILRVMNMGAAESNRVNTSFSDVTSEHWASGTIAEATGAGIVNGMGDGTFAPEAEVTYDQIVKMLVCAMGYQKKAEAAVAKGTNPFPTGYNIVANQKKITEGTTKTEGGATRATVARLIYNALPVNLMDQTSYGTDENFGEVATQSLLYTKLDAVKVEAKIAEISLDPTDDDVELDVTKYDDVYLANYPTTVANVPSLAITSAKKGDVDLTGLQGLAVTALIDISDKDEPVLLAVFSKAGKNDELVIAPELFEGAVDGKIQYKKNLDTSTVSTAKIESTVATYVNVASVGDWDYLDIDMLVNDNTNGNKLINVTNTNVNELKFVDTDNNGSYDTLFIDEAASFVVDRTDADEQGIYSSNSSSVMASDVTSVTGNDYEFLPLDLDTEDEDVSYVIKDSEGNELAFDDVKEGDILTVKQSIDGTYSYYDITVATSTAVEGNISEVSDKTVKGQKITYYTIDGTQYRVNGAASSSKLEAGTTGTFKITADGKIISYDLEASAKTFGVVIALGLDSGSFSSGIQAQVATTDGSIKTYDFASKVSVNGGADKTSNTMDVVKNGTKYALKDTATIVEVDAGTIVMFETNKDDEIRRIYTTGDAMYAKDSDIQRADFAVAGDEYNAVSGKIAGKYITDATTVLGVKNNQVTEKDKYSLASADSLSEDEKYTGSYVYEKSSKEILVAFITNLDVKPAYDAEAIVVTGVATTSVDGEKRDKITGYVGTKEVSYTVASSDDVDVYGLDGEIEDYSIAANEAIQVVLNANDEIIAIRKLIGYIGNDLCATVVTANLDKDTDDEDRTIDAKIVKLADNSVVSSETVRKFYGFAVAGKVNTISGANIEFFKDATKSTVDELTANSNLFSSTFNNTAYFYGSDYNKVKTGSLASVKTFNGLGEDLTKLNATSGKSTCEDIVYVYNYDGTNVLNYVYDPLNNSK